MPIKGLSEARRLPRLGRIRLGIRKKKSKPDTRCKHRDEEMCLYCSYPVETPHFVCPEEIQRVYGPQPKELDVYLPIDVIETVFPQRYAYYSQSGRLRCAGDGESALRVFKYVPPAKRNDYKESNGEVPDDTDLVDFPCTCPLLDEGDCSRNATLNVILPKINLGGVYSIVTGSAFSIININSGIDFVKGYFNGRAAMIPLILRREEQKIGFEDKMSKHWIMKLEFRGGIEHVNSIKESGRLMPPVTFALPAPDKPEPGGVYDQESRKRQQDEDDIPDFPSKPQAKTPLEASEVGGAHNPAAEGSTPSPATSPKPEPEAIPDTVATIKAELEGADPAKVDDVFNKHVKLINQFANKWKLHLQQVRDDRKKSAASGTQEDKLMREISLLESVEQCEKLKKDVKVFRGLDVGAQLRVGQRLNERQREIEGAQKEQRLL